MSHHAHDDNAQRHYGPHAFNSQKMPVQLKENRYDNDQCLSLGFHRPGLALDKGCIESYRLGQEGKGYFQKSHWDEVAWQITTNKKHIGVTGMKEVWCRLYYLIYGIAWIVMYLGPFFLLFIAGETRYGIKHGFLMGYLMLLYHIWLPAFALWLLHRFVLREWLKDAWVMRYTKHVNFSRKTGLVQVFNQDSELILEAPFIEFNAFSVPVFRPKSTTADYSLTLLHRYSNHFQVTQSFRMIFNSHSNTYGVSRLWCMIQRYMDTSQPMPDILPLEAARLRDPVTLAYDQSHNRPKRFWRDMTEEQYQYVLEEMRAHFMFAYNFGTALEMPCIKPVPETAPISKATQYETAPISKATQYETALISEAAQSTETIESRYTSLNRFSRSITDDQ